MRTLSAILLAAATSALFAQSPLAVPGCETLPQVRQTLEDKLGSKVTANMKGADQRPLERQVLGDLIAKYPRELEPHRRLIQDTRWMDPPAYPALVESYVKRAEQHPDDPLALYLAAVVLNGKDTPRAIQLLEQAKSKAPDFAWPDASLAAIHAGKRADKKQAAAEIAAFFAKCPSSTDGRAQWTLNRAGGTELQARVAVALRARLAKETDPKRLQDYSTLWGLEFRTRPVQEHDALRKQVADDLKRLESINPKPDAEWLAFLKDGYKQSGASSETVTAKEDRVMQAFPHSEEAYGIAYDRWKKAHKEPEDQKDAAAWKKYQVEQYATVKSWMAQFTDDRYVQHDLWFYTIANDPDISEKEGLQAFDDHVREFTDEYEQPSSWSYLGAANFLVDHKWQPQRALDLARHAGKLIATERELGRSDNDGTDEAKMRKEQEICQDQDMAGVILRAAKLAGKPDVAASLKASVEGPQPDDAKYVSDYWRNRARLAVLENRKADALTFYQQALYTRQRTPEAYHGRLKDDLLEEASAVWKDTGGTEVAWNVWKTPPAGKAAELTEGRWEKATKTMPAFELADLAGKTWRVKNLEGKSVLINVWATWCGPCQSELPHLQKLYEKVKDRSDLQIVTLNIDQELGLVAPFVKEKGFTFPVLPAYSFVLSLLDSVAIPQNWILDPKGAWRWSQLGFDASDAQWADTVLAKLGAVK